jgi:hypothetical protein
MYWRFRSIPELAGLPRAEQTRLWREARRDPFNFGDLIRAVIMLGGAVGVGLLLAFILDHLEIRWLRLALCFGAVFLAQLPMRLILIQRYRPVIRRLLP